jgi:hypothetical protein
LRKILLRKLGWFSAAHQHTSAEVILDQVLRNIAIGAEQANTRCLLVQLAREAVADDRVIDDRVRAVRLVGIDTARAVTDQQVLRDRVVGGVVGDVGTVTVARRRAVAAKLVAL